MTPLPITLCGPIPHTHARGLFREPPALQETEGKILLPLRKGTKPVKQHLSVPLKDSSIVTRERQNICPSSHFYFERVQLIGKELQTNEYADVSKEILSTLYKLYFCT